MKTCIAVACLAALLPLGAGAEPPVAESATPTLPAVKAEVILHVSDCDERVLPSQREVGEWTGQHNFSQVYATRQRLMGDIGRACQQAGIEQVHVIAQVRADASMQLVAVVDRRK